MSLLRKLFLLKNFKLQVLILNIIIGLVMFTVYRKWNCIQGTIYRGQNSMPRMNSEKMKNFFSRLSNHKVNSFNCANAFDIDFEMPDKLKKQAMKSPYPALDLLKMSTNCSQFKAKRGYILDSLTIEEESFPIAYGIFCHTENGQVEQLLKAIYRPQNIYVIHLDAKASVENYLVLKSIAKCFPNVFLSSKRVAVEWATYSLVEADMIVMKDLLRFRSWRYYINLCGMDFPLKTNLHIVRTLRRFKEGNAVQVVSRGWSKRWKKKEMMEPIPHNIKPVKGSHYVVVTRDFVNFTVNNQIAKDFRKWLNNTSIPDETFYSSLFYNGHIGTPHHYNSSLSRLHDIVKYVVWSKKESKLCSGYLRHNVCVFGLEDLKRLTYKKHLFANKFQNDLTLACLEEWFFNKTRDEYIQLRNRSFSKKTGQVPTI